MFWCDREEEEKDVPLEGQLICPPEKVAPWL
jgi:hypothetical protein